MRADREGIDEWDEESFYAKENIRLDDVIVSNKMLLDEVGFYLEGEESDEVRTSISELSDGLIEQLYGNATKKKNKVLKQAHVGKKSNVRMIS